MARYSLIMKDSTYMTLMKNAAKHGKTLGKFLNEILNEKAAQLEGKGNPLTEISMNPHCMMCKFYVLRHEWCPIQQRNMKPTYTCANFVGGK